MRIAVCMSGQLRNWELGVANQKWFWSTANAPNVEIDYFVHTWTYSWDREGVSIPYTERIIQDDEYSRFLQEYNPKKIILDSKPQNYFRGNDHWSALFYSFAQSINLKREYELENDFEYDVVVKTRPDVIFNPRFTFAVPKLWDGVIHASHGGPMENEYYMFNITDIVFYGNSYTMDLLTNLYFYRIHNLYLASRGVKNMDTVGPGVLMHEFFRDYGITPVLKTGYWEILLKEGCPKDLDLLNEEQFTQMERYFRQWYEK